MLYALGDKIPELKGEGHYIAPSADIAGKVILASRVNVWFNAVLRADIEHIFIGEDSNFQDCAVGHTDFGFPLNIGSGVTVGHGAILHGCSIGDGSLVGMNAVVLNGAQVGKECLIGAQALVPQGCIIPDRSLFLGAPGKVIKELPSQAIDKIKQNADFYLNLGEQFLKDCREL